MSDDPVEQVLRELAANENILQANFSNNFLNAVAENVYKGYGDCMVFLGTKLDQGAVAEKQQDEEQKEGDEKDQISEKRNQKEDSEEVSQQAAVIKDEVMPVLKKYCIIQSKPEIARGIIKMLGVLDKFNELRGDLNEQDC